MEWTFPTLIISALFVLIENSLYLFIGFSKKRCISLILSFAVLLIYTGMIVYGFMHGINREQALMLLLLSLPCAFIGIERGNKNGI